jgi:protocatechuate 3,4-dioxygenase beta subunit
VQNAISSRYQSWTLKPDYFVIIGDHDGPFAVPGIIRQDPNDGEDFATDLYYACFDGTGDYYPDIAHGRISVSSAEEAMTVIQKIVAYERTPVENNNFYQNGLNCAQFQDKASDNEQADGIAARRFTHTSEDIRDYVLAQGYDVERIYYTDEANSPKFFNDGYYSNKEPIPDELLKSNGYAWDGDAQDILSSINQGKFYLFHRDHGYSGGIGWAHPQFLSTNTYGHDSNIAQLQNGDLLPVVFSINCHTGEFGLEECFAEEFLRHPDGGAVGVVAASYYSYSGYNDGFSAGMVDAIWSNPGLTPVFGTGGVEDPPASSANNIRTMGDVVNQGLVRMIETWGDNKYTHELFHWFGDPAMRIWTENPNNRSITASIPSTIACDATSITITNCNTEEALVTIVDRNQLVASGSIANGEVTLTFPQQYYDSPLIVTISKENHKPFIRKIDITGECTYAPVADFSADSRTVIESQSISFTDQSTANPTSWEWSFEGGNPATSTEQNPVVTYATPGSYDVTLRASNANGWNTKSETEFISVITPSYCSASGGGDFYISEVNFNTLNHASGKEGYSDNTNLSTTVIPGNSYTLSLALSGYHTQLAENGVWVDWNNDGDFEDPHEELANTASLTMYISIPENAQAGEYRVRIRTTDEAVVPCGTSEMGEVEDYTLVIEETQPTTYNATFAVTDGQEPVEGATVTLTGYGQETTDVNGEVTFTQVVPEEEIPYTVDANGFNQTQGTLSIVDQDVTEQVTLTLTTYNATFTITDGQDPVEGATITLSGYGQATTDVNGQATFMQVVPENAIAYTVDADGFNQKQGTLSIVDQDVTEQVTLTLTTYNATFTVTDGQDPVEGATVTLTGYGQATTDVNGEVTFTQVVPKEEIPYTVDAIGFNQTQGTLSIVDQDVTEQVTLTLTTYDATFAVTDGQEPVEGATVALSEYGQATTDVNGEVTFTQVVPEEEIPYTVDADGFNQTQGTLSIVDQDVTEQVALTLTTYNATFAVTDGQDPVEGATVDLSGYGQATTDVNGEVTFTQVVPEEDIPYTVDANGFNQTQGTLSIVDQDVTEQVTLTLITYNATFAVTDGQDPVEGATVDLSGYGQATTDVNGEVTFTQIVPEEDIPYTVDADGYVQYQAEVSVINQDVSISIDLSLTTYSVTFAITNGNEPIEGATVSMDGAGQGSSDENGEVIFSQVVPAEDISYTVIAEGYDQIQGEVSVIDQNITEQVTLNTTTYQVSFAVNNGTNPLQGATINLEGYGQATTDAAGEATFANVAPQSNINYSVEASGYNTAQGEVSVIDQNITEQVTLNATTYQVSFAVDNGTNPLQGATINLEGYGQATTDAAGEATFANVAPENNIAYSVEASGYNTSQGEVSVIDQNITEQVTLNTTTYQVSFAVNEGTDPLQGATISLEGYGQATTDAAGEATFTNVAPQSNINYSVEASGYNTAQGEVSVIDQNITEQVTLNTTTYQVSFAVNEGTDPLQGATISLEGYGQATTDAAGEATFTNVAPENNIAYSVEASGYNTAQGEVSVIDQNITEQVTLNATTYQVSFAVNEGTNPLQGATINLEGYGQATTDAAGEATFANVAPQSNINYSVEASGYNTAQGEVSVIDQNITEQVTLNATTYQVSFAVNEGTDPLQGATISLEGYGQATTDAAGEATFTNVAPENNIAYSVEASGYNTAQGEVSVIDQNITEQVTLNATTYQVSFAVNNGTNPLQGATISLEGYGQATTDAAGEATFANVAPENNINYSVEASGYNTAQGEVSVIDQNITEQVTLTATTYLVSFAVNEGTNPLQGATISLEGYGQATTDAAGEATFANVASESNIAYSVEASGYNTVQSDLSVTNQDITEQVTLTEIATGIETLLKELTLYPNPAERKFALKTDLEGPFSIQIFNNLGRLVLEKQTVANGEDISIHDLSQGLYFIQIVFDGKVQTRRLIKH